MNVQQEHVIRLLQEKRFVKVISGIDNLDPERVAPVVRAASAAGAGAVDVAAQPDIVTLARTLTELPIFASSVSPQALAQAVAHGADIAEIGNFDALYKNGFYLTADDVLTLTKDTLALLPTGTPLSVTIPGYLSTEAQVRLAQRLESMGVAMLQTEGASRVISMTKEVQLLPADEKARLTMENTKALAQAVSIPVMTASGIHTDNIQEAFAMGASAVGIGSAVNRLPSEEEMIQVLTEMMAQVQALVVDESIVLAS